jgi:hypothetical protein
MPCRSCGSERHTVFGVEINIHFPGRGNLDQPSVLAFPKILICLDCGRMESTLPGPELALLAAGARKCKPSIGQKTSHHGLEPAAEAQSCNSESMR